MSLNYVELTLDLNDSQGNYLKTGLVTFSPSAQLTGSPGLGTQAPIVVDLSDVPRPQVVKLLATDNGAVLPSGWGWDVTFSGVPGDPDGFSFFLPFSAGASQNLSAQVPVSSVTTMQAYMPLPSGTAQSGQVPVATGVGSASAWGTQGLALQATTGLAGVALTNGTPTILTWTAPNDGNMHRLLLIPVLGVTSTQTGGAVTYSYTASNNLLQTHTLFAGGIATGTPLPSNLVPVTIYPGTTVTVAQSSAQTAGAAKLWCEIWAS